MDLGQFPGILSNTQLSSIDFWPVNNTRSETGRRIGHNWLSAVNPAKQEDKKPTIISSPSLRKHASSVATQGTGSVHQLYTSAVMTGGGNDWAGVKTLRSGGLWLHRSRVAASDCLFLLLLTSYYVVVCHVFGDHDSHPPLIFPSSMLLSVWTTRISGLLVKNHKKAPPCVQIKHASRQINK